MVSPPGPSATLLESRAREHCSHEKHFRWNNLDLVIIFSASKTLPPHRGQASLAPSLALIEVVFVIESARIVFPSIESRLGMDSDLDLLRDLDAALDCALDFVLDLDLLDIVPKDS